MVKESQFTRKDILRKSIKQVCVYWKCFNLNTLAPPKVRALATPLVKDIHEDW